MSSTRTELINRILAMTPEQLEKLFAHPEFIKVMEDARNGGCSNG